MNKLNDYTMTWEYTNKKELFELIKKYNPDCKMDMYNYYILDVFNKNKEEIAKEKENLHVIKYQIKEYLKSIEKLRKETLNLENSINSLEREINSISDQNLINNLMKRKEDQDKLLLTKVDELSDLEIRRNNLITSLDEAIKEPIIELEKQLNSFKLRDDILVKSVIHNYNEINNKVKDADVNKDDSYCYNQIWKLYLKDDEMLNNINNVHLVINKIEKTIINSNIPINQKLSDLKIVSQFYKNLNQDIISYFGLSNRLDENKMLNMKFEFINHITKNIIAEALILSIKDVVFEEVRMKNQFDPIIHSDQNTYFNYLFNMLDDIFNQTINIDGQTYQLDDYIKNELNSYIVQNILNVKTNKEIQL